MRARIDSSEYAFLIRQCGLTKSYEQGKQLHARLAQSTHRHELFLENLLIQMYAKCGSLQDAENLFDTIPHRNNVSWNILLAAYADNGHLQSMELLFNKMPQTDSVSWNTMITAYGQCGGMSSSKFLFDQMPERNLVSWNSLASAYAQNGYHKKSLSCIPSMDLEGIQPDSSSFVVALNVCGSLESLRKARVFHECTRELRLPNIPVWNSVVTMYGKCGSIGQAKEAFDSMVSRDITSWIAMVIAYSNRGYFEEAKLVYEKSPGTNIILCNVLLRAHGNSEDVEQAERIFNSMPEKSIVSENSILDVYSQNGQMLTAVNLFSRMVCKDVVSWTTLMRGYSRNGDSRLAVELLARMTQEGTQPNQITYVVALDACSMTGDLKQGCRMHQRIAESGFQYDRNVSNSLIHMYGKCRSPELARHVFDRIPTKCVVTWNSMISACVDKKGAYLLLQEMLLDGVLPNDVTFVGALDGCEVLEDVKLIHELAADTWCECHTSVASMLVSVYGRLGHIQEAKLVFDRVPEHSNLVLFTSMVTAYARNLLGVQALLTFKRMDLQGVVPNEVTFISALDACSCIGKIADGRILHMEVVHLGYIPDTDLANSLVNMYVRCGELGCAGEIFRRISHRDVISWNVMILGYARNGHVGEAIGLQLRMVHEGVMPNEQTFMGVFSACGHAGLVKSSFAQFVSISTDFFMTPSVDHFLCMVGILARAGNLYEAEELVAIMPYEPDYVAWTSLLGACRAAGDVERGFHAAERGQCLQPEKNAPYVLLTNLFAERKL